MDVMEINWVSIVVATFSITATIVGAATAYLRLFVAAQLHLNTEALKRHVDDKFALKELVENKIADNKDDIREIKAEIILIKGKLEK